MSLRYAILGILEATPMTGYELGQRFASSARWVWSAPLSQIYPLLGKLEAEGLIAGEEGVAAGRTLRRYSLSGDGRAALIAWVAEVHPPAAIRDPLLLQALFLDFVDTTTANHVLQETLRAQTADLALWRDHRDALAAGRTPVIEARLSKRDPAEHARIKRIKASAFDGLIALGEARIAWTKQMLDAVRE